MTNRDSKPENKSNAAAKLRAARKRLRDATCNCDGKHDPFWMRCERALAEVEADNALATFGVFL